ncbi:LOW QUALITY PROTEIN: aminopeptidase Q [Ahaetulla prasina]|uniref:LOW QUALITY PROTEIN: aminopeptidase Q n=1 Tax=Ahaetulla prasina TaxID=499056 RepID=UPI002649B310|nr:LOW QUALITY PROTEIN: aminopeptidase Q [Ahaetulla prasina]
MSAKLRSGFYLGKKSALLLALLPAALLVALLVLAILYGRCARGPKEFEQPSPAVPTTPWANASAEPTARPPGPWDQQRLPRHVTPIHYSLLLWPHLAPGLPKPRTHSGQVNITVRCHEATSAVLLHSAELTYRSASVWGPLEEAAANSTRSIPLGEVWTAPGNQYLVLELLETLRAGSLYELRFAFQGKIQPEPEYFGLFLNTYKDEGEKRWMIVSQLQPTAARHVYPCFDEPAMKATFNISIVHHPSYVALSNMLALDVSEYKDVNDSALSALMNETTPINWTITTFETTLKMSTYITAFVVCNERGNQIRIWARKDAVKKGFTNYALNIIGPIFSYLEDLLNISYPLSKTDLVAVPLMEQGAMENWGLMTFHETSLLNDPEDKYIANKMQICRVVAHEVAHQWFGNLVTMDWWNDLWLNEGFATYFEYIGLHYIEHIMPLDKLFSKQLTLPVLAKDIQVFNQSLSDSETHQTDSLLEVFNEVPYYKGAVIIRMLSNFMTEGLFIKALNSYLSAFSFSNAVQDDLWTHLQKVIDEQNDFQLPTSVKIIMDSWTCQKGYPLLTVDFSTGNISQEPSFAEKGEHNSDTWIIPISWIRNGTLQPLVWLDKRSKIFPEMKISDSVQDWIVLNVNMSGYYRINYDQNHWRRLAKVLEDDPKAIPSTSRLQLMADASHLAWSNFTGYETPLYLTKYLEKEDDSIVWAMALHTLGFSEWDFLLRDPELFPILKRYLLPRITPIFHHYANLLRESPEALDKNPFTKHDVEEILGAACWFGLRDCLDLASEFLNMWMNNSKHEIPVCFSSTICCYGVWLGNEEEWEFLWKIFKKNETKDAYKANIFFALSCTRIPWLLQRYLNYIHNDVTNPPIITARAVYHVVKNEIGYWTAWTFVSENWSDLSIRFTLQALMITTDIQMQMIQVFVNNTLEPEEKIMATDIMLTEKSKNEKRKKSITKMIMWLKENMDN